MKKYMTSLLSLIPLSYIVASNRELANTLFSFITSTHSNPSKQYNINMDMEINTPRIGWPIPVLIALELY